MVYTLRYKMALVAVLALTGSLVSFSSVSTAAESSESPWIGDGSKVTLLYEITVPGDERFEVRDLSQFVQGQHQMLPALERAVTGMRRGEKTQIRLTEDQGFGAYDQNKKTIVPATELPAGTKTGDVLEDAKTGKQATVTQMSDSAAVVDYNHPLAGKPLLVTLTILEVDNPS